MTALGALGYTLITIGPSFVLFAFTCLTNPVRLIVITFCAFGWLVGLLLSSVFLFALSNLPTKTQMALSLIPLLFFQELARGMLFYFYNKINLVLNKLAQVYAEHHEEEAEADNTSSTLLSAGGDLRSRINSQSSTSIKDQNTAKCDLLNSHLIALLTGLAFAIMPQMADVIKIVSHTHGQGTLMEEESGKWFFLILSLQSCFFGLLQIPWSLMLSHFYLNKLYLHVVLLLMFRISLSYLSLGNTIDIASYVITSLYAIFTPICFSLAIKSLNIQIKSRRNE